jgi:hypothetical protein
MKIEIETSDRELAFPHDESVDLGNGVRVNFGKPLVRKGFDITGFEISQYVIDLTVQIAAGVPSGVAAQLLINWLWPRKDRNEKITLEKTEIELDDKEKLKKIVVEKIEKTTGLDYSH